MNRALRAATMGVLLLSPVALSACSAGQVTQTATQQRDKTGPRRRSATSPARGRARLPRRRAATTPGDDAELQMAIVNDGTRTTRSPASAATASRARSSPTPASAAALTAPPHAGHAPRPRRPPRRQRPRVAAHRRRRPPTASATPAARQPRHRSRADRARDPGRPAGLRRHGTTPHHAHRPAVRAHDRSVPHADPAPSRRPATSRSRSRSRTRRPPLEPQRRLRLRPDRRLTAPDRRSGRPPAELSAAAVSVGRVPARRSEVRPPRPPLHRVRLRLGQVGRPLPGVPGLGQPPGGRRARPPALRAVSAGPVTAPARPIAEVELAGARAVPDRHRRVRPRARRRPGARGGAARRRRARRRQVHPAARGGPPGGRRATGRRWSSPARSPPARCGCAPSGSAPCTSGSTWPPRPSCPPSSRHVEQVKPTLLDPRQRADRPLPRGRRHRRRRHPGPRRGQRAHRRRQEPRA